ncbi:hypothetical protein ABX042_13195 [Snodgrassella alvi]|uniref:hypothetical protein n=1 Tax=Snodgrassella alvi TaxID=1196083 RepID=UPI00345F75E9
MMEVTEHSKDDIQYPVARRSLTDGAIVLFLSKDKGVVIRISPDSGYDFGYFSDDWISCSEKTIWEPVDITITG